MIVKFPERTEVTAVDVESVVEALIPLAAVKEENSVEVVEVVGDGGTGVKQVSEREDNLDVTD